MGKYSTKLTKTKNNTKFIELNRPLTRVQFKLIRSNTIVKWNIWTIQYTTRQQQATCAKFLAWPCQILLEAQTFHI